MPVRVDVISIGTLGSNRIWNEKSAVRTPHATTTLIRASAAGESRERRILVDPALPPPALAARLFERTGLKPNEIDTIFLTCFKPAHRGGIGLFEGLPWLLHDVEREAVGEHLEQISEAAGEQVAVAEAELDVLRKTRPPEGDKLAEQVDLFPLFGPTPGTCGLLIAEPASTTLVTGDAVPTRDHLLAAQLLQGTFDVEAAGEAMREVYEVADAIVPGHDNWFANPRSHGL